MAALQIRELCDCTAAPLKFAQNGVEPRDISEVKRAASIRRALIGSIALACSSTTLAQVPDLQLPGALPHQLSEFGLGLRDALRKKLGTCYRPVDGGILVCGHRKSYRMDRSVFEADRNSGSGSDYDHYLEARARHQGEVDN